MFQIVMANNETMGLHKFLNHLALMKMEKNHNIVTELAMLF